MISLNGMPFVRLEKYTWEMVEELRKQYEEEKESAIRVLLLPIWESLGLDRERMSKYKFPSSQVSGVIIAEIRKLKDERENQRKSILKLKKEKEERGQMVVDFIKNVGRRQFDEKK